MYQLGAESLWSDEGASLRASILEGPAEIVERAKTIPTHPIHDLFLHYWVALFGDSEFSLRFPSVLAGLLGVFMMYKVGSLLFGRGVGLMASLILAMSPFHIQYSQEARGYSLEALLALISFYCFIKIFRKRELTVQVGYVLSTITLMYSHAYSLFIVLAQNIYFAAIFLSRTFGSRNEARPSLGRWMVLQALLIVLYIPGLILLAIWLSRTTSRSWIPSTSFASVYGDLVEYAGSPLLLALLLIFALLAGVALLRSGAADNLFLLLAWFMTPVVLPMVVSSFSTPIFHPRYGIAGSLALYLLAAKGVEVASDAFSKGSFGGIPKASKARTVWLTAAAVLIVLFSVELWSYYNTVKKPQWREAAQYLDTHAQTDDLVLVEGYTSHETLFEYYSKSTDVETVITGTSGGGEAMEPGVEAHDRVWVVKPYIFDNGSGSKQSVSESVFEKGHTPVEHEQYEKIDLILYEKR